MRVLVVSTWLPTRSHPSTGVFVVKDAQAIASIGHDVALIHLVPPHQGEAPRREEIGGLPVTRIPMSTSRADQVLATGRALGPLIRRADLVHSMAFSSLLPMTVSHPPVPWVHTEHWSGLTTSSRSLPRWRRLLLPAVKPLLRGPHVVTAVSDYLAAPIRQLRGERPTLVVPCIVPAPPGGPQSRPTGTTLNLVSVGALVPGKDPLLAVDTVAELRRRGHEARIRFVGQGELAPAVRQRAAEAGIGDQVELVGTRDRQGVLAELAWADLFLGPTRGDNFFVSCAEALACGRPVVVGATGGHVEYIAPEVGLTLTQRDAGAYADAVEQVLHRTKGVSAQDISASLGGRFEPDVVARGYQRAYDLAIQRHGAGR